MSAIDAVAFDFDHTLGIDNKLERVAFLHMLELACERGGLCNGTLAEEIANIDALLASQRNGACSIEQAVATFMRDRGVADAEYFAGRYKQMCVDMVEQFVIAEPGARTLLDALRRREMPSAILTNGWSPLQQYKAVRVGFTGSVVVSADLGVQKPQRAAFDAVARALDVPNERIAYVGDNPESDMAGALEAGMQAIWYDTGEIRYPQALPRPTAVIHSLTELLTLV